DEAGDKAGDKAGDEAGTARLVATLVDHGLATGDAFTVTLDPAARAAVRQATAAERWDAVIRLLLALLREDLPGRIYREPEAWPRWRQLLDHVRVVLAEADGYGDAPVAPDEDPPEAGLDLSWIYDRAATFLREHGDLPEAVAMFRRALAIDEHLHGSESL